MVEKSEHAAGSRIWVDLGSPDVSASSRFYAEVFGWETGEAGDPETTGGYAMFLLRGKNVAGLAPLMSEGQPPAWTSYVATDDVDKTAELVTSNGGNVVMPPMDVLDSGRMGLFTDPTGAVFGVWQPQKHIGAEIVNEPGAVCWFELTSRDTTAASAFYPEVFGWTADTSSMEEMNYTVFKSGDQDVAGLMGTPDQVPAEIPSYWMPYFEVADTDHTVATAEANGASVILRAHDVPTVGRIGILRDPHGATFGVLQATPA
ncbi:MAG: VOC family protein [Mycobacteriales bacterium]